MQRVTSILKALGRNKTTSIQRAFSSSRQFINLLVAIVVACLMTGASPATQRSRRIIFEINVDEPRPGFVLQVQRELVGRGGPVNLTRVGNKFIGEYLVPDTLRENIECRLLIQIDDPVQPWMRLQYSTKMDFTRPESPDFKIERHYRFFPLQIEAVERDARGAEQPCFPDVGFYRRAGDQRERILYTGVQSDRFRSGRGKVDTFFFSETFLQPIGTEIQVHGALTIPGTFNNNAIASFIVPRTGAARVRLVFYAWQTAIRRAVQDALRNAGIPQANAETISQVPINGVAGVAFADWRPLQFPFTWTSGSNYQIALAGGFNLQDSQCGDSLMHEFTHETLYQMSWQPAAPPNAGHDIEVPASIETQAWEEGLCHFIGTHLLTRIVEKQTPIGHTNTAFWIDATNDRVRERAVANRNQPSLNSPARTVMQNPGNWIEGVVTGSLLELYYEQGINPQTDLEGVLKAFIADLRDFCTAVPRARWTVEEFFRHRVQNPRNRIPLFESRVVDQIALWYLLTTRGQVRDVDRLVPVILRPGAAATVKTGEVVELRASARAFHRLVGQYRAYRGASLRARLYEGTRQIGTDVPLDQSSTVPNYSVAALLTATFNDPGAHRVRAEIWGDFIDGTMERLGISDEIEITVEKKDENDKTKAEERYNWLQQCVPYLEELIRLDEQEYMRLERAVHAEILKRVNEGQYPLGLSDSERQRMEQLEREFASRPAGRIQKIRDPLTGEERLGYVQTGAPLTEAEKQKGLELARLRAKADPAYAIVHYEFECLEKALEERMTHKRDLKARLEALKDSKAYKYFAEFKAYNDYKGYLREVAVIEAILKLPMPLPKPPKLPWAYSAPCASPPVGPTVSPFDVTLVATPASIAPGEMTRIAANVRGGKAPFSYAWTGHTSGQGATVSLTSTVPGDRQVSVTVTDATGRTTTNTIKITVTALEVILEKLAPSGNDVVFGLSASLAAKVFSGGKPVSGNYVYRWQPHPEVKFTPPEGNQNAATAIFQRPGKVTLWVSVLENRQGQLVTLAESKPLELMVTPPVFEVAFDKAAPYIGEETRARVVLRQPIPPDRIAFKWEATPNAKLVGEAQDAREIVFLPSNDAPLTVTVRASVPFYGDSLGEKSATLKATPYEVRAITVSRPPFSVENNVELMATIKPDTAKKPVRFLWSVAPDSNNHIVGQEAGKTVTINRSATGMCAIELEAFDGNGFRIGKDTTSFQVSISAADLKKAAQAKEAAQKVLEAKHIVPQGKLDEAITLVEEAGALDPTNTEASRLSNKWKSERSVIQQQLARVNTLLDEARFGQAQRELSVAENINPRYPPVQETVRRFHATRTSYDNAIRDGLGAIKMAMDAREFQKVLDVIQEMRTKLKLDDFPKDLESLNLSEQYARRHEAEKDRQRAILKRGEEKLRQYDYVGALEDFNVIHAQGNFYEHWSVYQPEPRYYDKLRIEVENKLRRINTLLSAIRPVANNPNSTTEVIEQHIKYCDEVLMLQPPNAEAQRLRAVLMERLNKTISKTKTETLLKQGAELYTQKKYAEAIVVFDEVISLDPGLSEAWRQRGMAKRELKDYRGAITDFTRAIELNPNNSQALAGRGIARERNNDAAGALADYTRAIQLNPRYENAYSYRGHLHIEQKEYASAKADYDQVITLNPKNQVAWNNRGVAKERLSDLQGALGDYEQALALNPDYELARRNAERVRNLLAGGKNEKKGETGLINLSGAKWNWFDPNADATYNVAGDTITIVAPNGNDLWPAYNFNAPRLTKLVSGDFILTVRVQGAWRENYNGAGLTVYSGKDSVIRFERGIHGVPGGNHVVIFGFVNGRETGRAHIPFPGQDVYLKLERNGSQFTAYASADGVSWTKVGTIKTELPATVEAGLTLVNQHNSNTFRATFSSFDLLQVTSPLLPTGNEMILFQNGNVQGVSNGPARPTTFTLRQTAVITSIQNYHWNNGRGAVGGTISLRGADGRSYGPWNVITSTGQGGAPNVYWNCAPHVKLLAGTYTVIDSDPATWSYNGQSGGSGFTIIKGIFSE